jgi:integrase/recombinase XerD
MIRTCDPLIRSQVLYPAELRVRILLHLHQFDRRIECMTALFEQFLKERTYIKNVSPKTLDFYRSSFKAYQKINGDASLPTKKDLTNFVTGMREKGIKPVSCNTYIRGINSFLTWLYENEYIPEPLKIKQLKTEQKVMKTFDDKELRLIISYKPRKALLKIHTLVLLGLDTGCRINEILTLTKEKIDFDNLLISVIGKGNKERIIPISFDCRKVLYKYVKTHPHNLVFCTKQGGKLMYNNIRRDYFKLLDAVGVEKCDQSFHSLRRLFAEQYVRNGGNLFYLMNVMGHSDIKTTQIYVKVDTKALQDTHLKTSILSRVR